MSLNVTIPDTFNGPLDLLFHLIRRDEMDIYDIPIARLTSSYLEEMRRLEIVDVDEGAEFLDLASRLLEIKSRMLMPPEELADEAEAEEEENFDPRAGLVEALLEYRRFKDAARMLGDMAEEQARRYPRVAPRPDFRIVEEAAEGADCLDLLNAFQAMLVRMMPEDDSNVITYTEVPTSVRIEQIRTVLAEAGKTRFSLLLSGAPNRREMVGFFIAMLEMIRQGLLVARQADNFADIVLERREPDAARATAETRTRRVPPPPPFPAPPPRARSESAGAARAPGFPRPAPSRTRVRVRKIPVVRFLPCPGMPHGGKHRP